MPLFYEGFELGKKFVSGVRTVRQADIDGFAALTGDLNRLHIDEEYAKTTVFRGRIAHGLLVLSLALGLWYEMNVTRASLIALVGINNVAFRGPVYPGDKVRLLSEVASKRLSTSRQGAGIVVFKDRVVNKKGEAVMDFERVILLRTEGGGGVG